MAESAALVGGHRYIEDALFASTGRWSAQAAAAPDPLGISEFFAAQSMIHAWRAKEWEGRLPHSVQVPPDVVGTGWSDALVVADSARSSTARLACWCSVLGVHLAGRYRRHRLSSSRAADAGMVRWLDLATGDVLEGVAEGAAILTRGLAAAEPVDAADMGSADMGSAGMASAEMATVVGDCVAALFEAGS